MIGKIAIGAAAVAVTCLVGIVVQQSLRTTNDHQVVNEKIEIGFNEDGSCYFNQTSYETNKKSFRDKLHSEGDNPCQLLLEGKLDFSKVTWVTNKGIENENAKKTPGYDDIKKRYDASKKQKQ